MPETIRTANGRLRSRPWRGGNLAAFVTVAICHSFFHSAHAQSDTLSDALAHGAAALGPREVEHVSLVIALICFALLAVFALLRTRRSAGEADNSKALESVH